MSALVEDQLAAFVDRILRLKKEADDIASDIKEIYAEAHANGYNKTRLGEVVAYLRKVEKDATGEAEKAALRDLYLDAYYRAKKLPHAHAYARDEEFDTETGEIIEPQPVSMAVQTGAPQRLVTSPVESEAVAISTPIQPETANDTSGENGHVAADAAGHGRVEADAETQPQGGENVATTSAQHVAGEGAQNASVTPFTPKPLRPYCLNPGTKCGGQGKKHCWSCEKAHSEAQGAA